MKRAIIDIDDTIAELVPLLVEVFNEMSGAKLTVNDWTSYNVYDIYGVPQKEYFEVCNQRQIMERCMPICLAKETLDVLHYDMKWEILYLTARGWHPLGREITDEWLRRWEFPQPENLHVVGVNESKVNYLIDNEIYADLLADDNPKHVKDFINHSKELKLQLSTIFMIDQPWNKANTELNPYRVSSIFDILYKDLTVYKK
jgi:uncharacterized HAD superfamily protein